MTQNIPVPIFLEPGKARELNNKLIRNKRWFAFLDEPEVFINKAPSTYAEAFVQYISRLYVLYHDHGMSILKSYAEQYKEIKQYNGYFNHIRFAENARCVLQHSDDHLTRGFVFSNLRNHFFYNDYTFSFRDWNDFWLNATEDQWKTLVLGLVNDSNKFYKDCMMKIAENDNSLRPVINSMARVFRTDINREGDQKTVDIYDRAFDGRLITNIYNSLKDVRDWTDNDAAKKELRRFNKQSCTDEELNIIRENGKRTPQEIKAEAIVRMKRYLANGACRDSADLFPYLIQTVHELIQEQIEEDEDL